MEIWPRSVAFFATKLSVAISSGWNRVFIIKYENVRNNEQIEFAIGIEGQ